MRSTATCIPLTAKMEIARGMIKPMKQNNDNHTTEISRQNANSTTLPSLAYFCCEPNPTLLPWIVNHYCYTRLLCAWLVQSNLEYHMHCSKQGVPATNEQCLPNVNEEHILRRCPRSLTLCGDKVAFHPVGSLCPLYRTERDAYAPKGPPTGTRASVTP